MTTVAPHPNGHREPPDLAPPPDGDTLPRDLHAEQCTLGAAILSKDARDDIADIIGDGDWYDHRHTKVWAAIKRLRGAGAAIDEVTVVDALRAVGDLRPVGGDLAV